MEMTSYFIEGKEAGLAGEFASGAAFNGRGADVGKIGAVESKGSPVSWQADDQLFLGGAFVNPLRHAVILEIGNGRERERESESKGVSNLDEKGKKRVAASRPRRR